MSNTRSPRFATFRSRRVTGLDVIEVEVHQGDSADKGGPMTVGLEGDFTLEQLERVVEGFRGYVREDGGDTGGS